MTQAQPITIASLLHVAPVTVAGNGSQAGGKSHDVDLAGLVREGYVQFVDAQGQSIPPGQEAAIAQSVLTAIGAKTGKTPTAAEVAELTQALLTATATRTATQTVHLPAAKGKTKADGSANQEFLAALVNQMMQAQGVAAPVAKSKSHLQTGVIRVSLPILSSPAAGTTQSAGTATAISSAQTAGAASAQVIAGAAQTINNNSTLTQDAQAAAASGAADLVATAATEAQAIQSQAQAQAGGVDAAGQAISNGTLTQDALAAAVAQAQQAAAAAKAVPQQLAWAAKAHGTARVGGSDRQAALPTNPLGVVLPAVASPGKAAAPKAPAVAAPAVGNSVKPAQRSADKADKNGNARLAAATAGTSLSHDDILAAAQAAHAGTDTPVAQGAQAATATADTPAGAALAMPAPLAEQIAAQLPLDGSAPGVITIHLNPPELGRLELTFENDHTGVTAVIRAENPDTLTQLRQEMPSVLEKISETGVNLKRVEVSLSGQQGNAADSAGREGMWQQARQEQPLRWGRYEEDAAEPEAAAATQRSAGWSNGSGLNVWI